MAVCNIVLSEAANLSKVFDSVGGTSFFTQWSTNRIVERCSRKASRLALKPVVPLIRHYTSDLVQSVLLRTFGVDIKEGGYGLS